MFGGKAATFFNNPITGSKDPALYQSVRYDLQGYRFTMPNGPCRVTLEQQSLLRTQFLVAHDQRLEQLLGEPLPATAQAWKDYRGPARLIVLTARGSATKGKQLVVAIIAAAFRTSTSQRPLRLLGRPDNYSSVDLTPKYTGAPFFKPTLTLPALTWSSLCSPIPLIRVTRSATVGRSTRASACRLQMAMVSPDPRAVGLKLKARTP